MRLKQTETISVVGLRCYLMTFLALWLVEARVLLS